MSQAAELWKVRGGGLSGLGGASLNISTVNNNAALALIAVLFVVLLWRKT